MIRQALYVLLTGFLLFVNGSTLLAQFSDDFSDGDFTNSPTWTGEDTKFEVDGSFRLHSNGPAVSDTAYLSTSTGTLDFNQTIAWEFVVEMQFSPSNNNNARIFLMSDNANLRGSLNGYYVRIGESGSTDAIKIYEQSGTTSSLIFTGTGNIFPTSPIARVRVIRDGSGNWTVESDATGGTTFVSEGAFTDLTHTTMTHFGVYCKYTSTNSTNFYFDDFNLTGTVFTDTTPPTLLSADAISNTEVDVLFDEAVDPATAQTTSNYSADGGLGPPSSAIVDGGNPALVHLTYGTTFINGQTYNLTVNNVEDVAGNAMASASDDFVFFVPDTPSFREVVINEIMADPTPQVGLLDAEFVELHNVTTSKFFDLTGWEITDGSSSGSIGSYSLGPGEYVILVATGDVSSFSPLWPNVIGVTSFPGLNNGGETLTLNDDGGTLIDEVTYDDSWYQDATKEDGGYTLEQINPELPCSSESNWTASNDVDGGTPGLINSVYNNTPDTTAPSLLSVDVLDNVTLLAHFDEPINTPGSYTVTPLILVTGAAISGSNPMDVVVDLGVGLDTGIVYTLDVTGSGDCTGNSLINASAEFVLPHEPQSGDLIINEVLFNPFTGGDDFVEVYNNSNRYIDVYGFSLANLDDDTISNPNFIGENRVLAPGDYVVFTEDSLSVKRDYLNAVAGSFVQTGLPTYSNESGTVYLILPNDSISDFFAYHEDMHFGLINDPDGVSLERIDFNRSAQEDDNWHSAAEAVGFATPGYENSQYFPGTISEDMVSLEPEAFSPDNDGFEDVLNISYNMNEPGFVANVTIYDAKGRLIRHLVQNELLGSEGIFTWDGTDNDRLKARIGPYILFFEVFSTDGTVSAVKKPFVVAGQF